MEVVPPWVLPTIVLGLAAVSGSLVVFVGSRGGLSRAVSRGVWRASRGLRRRGRVTDGAGALAMLAVVGTWTSLIVLG